MCAYAVSSKFETLLAHESILSYFSACTKMGKYIRELVVSPVLKRKLTCAYTLLSKFEMLQACESTFP